MPIKQTKIFRFLSSIKLAICLLSFIAAFSVIGTLIPQNKQPVEYINRYGHSLYDIFSKTGMTDVYSAWWFILLLVLLSLNLSVCLFKRIVLKPRFLGTLLVHLSILVVLAGALIGMFYGEKGYMQIREGESINSFFSGNKKVVLDFYVHLDDFIYTESIDPKERLLVRSEDGELLSEIPVKIGSQVNIADSGFKVRILRYLPDFIMDISTKKVVSRSNEPRNPALEVELESNDGGITTFWVFASYPDIHKQIEKNFNFSYHWAWRRPKDFISKLRIIKDDKTVLEQDIRVNSPLKFGGYTFFQSSYDKEHHNWSGVQVVKDPGVAVVYSGFFLLILGLVMIFYINPLIKRSIKDNVVH
jgi:hypothetical protein